MSSSGGLAKWKLAGVLAVLLASVWLSFRWERTDVYAASNIAIELSGDELYEANAEAVFYLRVYKKDGTLKTVGTGFLIGGGRALTAYHVVKDGVSFEAVFDDGTKVGGMSVIQSDETLDIAVLRVKAGTRKTLELAVSDGRHGEQVFAMGYPLKETKIITEGIVNAPAAMVNGVSRLLTSAQIASGMSGGPLFDRYGHVTGLISGSFRTMNNIHICATVSQITQVLSMEGNQ